MITVKIEKGNFFCVFCGNEKDGLKVTEQTVRYCGGKGAVSDTITCKYCGRNIPQRNQVKKNDKGEWVLVNKY